MSSAAAASGVSAELVAHADRATQEVDIGDAQREQLGDAQPEPRLREHQRAGAVGHLLGEHGDLDDGERDDTLPLCLGQGHPPDRRAGDEPVGDRTAVDRSQQG